MKTTDSTTSGITVGTRTRAHIELNCDQRGGLEARVMSADGILRAEVPIGLTEDDYTLDRAVLWTLSPATTKHNGKWAQAVVLRVLSVNRAHAAHAALDCTD